MQPIPQEMFKHIGGGAQCEVVTQVRSSDPNNGFGFNSSISGECDSLKRQYDEGIFHDQAKRWLDLGYEVKVEFVQ